MHDDRKEHWVVLENTAVKVDPTTSQSPSPLVEVKKHPSRVLPTVAGTELESPETRRTIRVQKRRRGEIADRVACTAGNEQGECGPGAHLHDVARAAVRALAPLSPRSALRAVFDRQRAQVSC